MTTHDALSAGARDIRRAAQILASRVPGRLAALADVDCIFSWTRRHDGEALFRSIDPFRWRTCRQNPERLLQEAPEESLERAAINPAPAARAEALRDALETEKARPLTRPSACSCICSA